MLQPLKLRIEPRFLTIIFNSVFTKPKNIDVYPDFNIHSDLNLGNITFSINDVYELLINLDTKAICPDGISPIVLRNCAMQLSAPLCYLYNLSMSTSSQLPEDWLKANVVPIYKNGDKNNVTNYRPIS